MQSNAAQELLGTQVSQAMRFADLPMMSVASESESQEASAMRDPSLHLGQTTDQSTYTSTDDSRELERRGNFVLKDGISRYAKLINGAKLISWIYERYCVYDRTM